MRFTPFLCFLMVGLLLQCPCLEGVEPPQIVVIAGSNGPGVVTRGLAERAKARLQELGAEVSTIDLGQVDLAFPYGSPPPRFLQIEVILRGADGILAIVPEYQGSYPGIMKVFLDQLDYPASPLAGKIATFIGHSGGDSGGRVPVETLSRDFQTQGAHIFSARTFIPRDTNKLSGDGSAITDRATEVRMESQLQEFWRFLVQLKAGATNEPDGKLFSPAERQQCLLAASLDPAAMHAAVAGPATEKKLVDAEIAYFRAHRTGLSARAQACFWEELSSDVDSALNYHHTHVARGYQWRHDGETYFIYQGPLAFSGGKHATIAITPTGGVLAGLADPIYDITHWSLDLATLKPW